MFKSINNIPAALPNATDSRRQRIKIAGVFLVAIAFFFIVNTVSAHHVLGRPAYSLSEDSNTPPSMQVETQIGDYYVTYMVYPAFPKPNEPGRINLYASRIDNGDSFDGLITFSVTSDSWFSKDAPEVIGTQSIDDGVYRQGFLFKESGSYIISAYFEAGGEPYTIDFPLQIGATGSMRPVFIALGVIIFALISVNVLQRRRLLRDKIRSRHTEEHAA